MIIQAVNCYSAASAAGPGISFVGSGAFDSSAGAGTYNFSSLLDAAGGTPTVLTNDCVIVIGGASTTANRPESVMKPSVAAGYTTGIAVFFSSSNPDANLCLSYKFMGGSPDTSFAYDAPGGTGTGRGFLVCVLRGVNTSTPQDVTGTTANATGTGAANPPSITPTTAGSWIMASGVYAHATDQINFTNPGDLASTTNHFRSVTFNGSSRDGAMAFGLKENWTSGAFDPTVFSGGSTSGTAAWCALSAAFRPA